MKPGITLDKIWSDNDMVEFNISSSDGTSLFVNKVYVGYGDLEYLIVDLDRFKDQIHGGICDIRLSEFGPEYARGAFLARLHFQDRGKIYITIHAQSDFENFGEKTVASESMLYFISEPALLDNFIVQLKALNSRTRDDARLDGVN